jgi:hypothetical protein
VSIASPCFQLGIVGAGDDGEYGDEDGEEGGDGVGARLEDEPPV